MQIHNIVEYAQYFGTTPDLLKKDMYKYTDCGAWIHWNKNSMTIGSIVEGSDAEFSRTFNFPCTTDEIDDWLEELEHLTDEAWHEANDFDKPENDK